jgi:hypothetical protein
MDQIWVRAIEKCHRWTPSLDQAPLTLMFGKPEGDGIVAVDFPNWDACSRFLHRIISVPSGDLRDHLRKRLQIDLDSYVDCELSPLLRQKTST